MISLLFSKPVLVAFAILAVLGVAFHSGANWQYKRDAVVSLHKQLALKDLQIEVLQRDVSISQQAEAVEKVKAGDLAAEEARLNGAVDALHKETAALPPAQRCALGADRARRLRAIR